MRNRHSALLMAAIACGPELPEIEGSADGGATHNPASTTGAETASPSSAGEADADTGALPSSLCGWTVPVDCAPWWPGDVDIGVDPETSSVSLEDEFWIDVHLASSRAGTPSRVWDLVFVEPCWELPRSRVLATLTVHEAVDSEYELLGEYRAGVDVEFLNACAHLQIHEVEVHDAIEPDGAPPFEFPGLVPTGIAHAPIAP